MKIVYCIAGTYNSGGMERVLANKANYLVGHGYEVAIVTTDQRGRRPFFRLDSRIACHDLGIGYEDNNGKSFLNKLVRYPFKQWKHRMRLTRLLKRLRADIVISMFCNDAAFIPDIHDGSHKLLEVHFSRFKRLQYGRKGIWKLADNFRSARDASTVRRFERFVVLTEEDKTYWGNISNIRVIPNSLSFTSPHPAALTAKKVIAIGRYSHQKGFERLIDAWKHVSGNADGWNLHIVGDGELRDALQHQIDALGLGGEVFLDRPTSDIQSLYNNASILAMSSRYEGLPMVLLEAQAAGLPAVSFACKCGPRDVISDGVDGILVEEGNVKDLAAALLSLIHDDDKRKQMGAAAFKRSERFGEPAVMKMWTDMFSEIIAEK